MKAVLAVSIVTNLGLLAVFKYTGFVAENVNALGAALGLGAGLVAGAAPGAAGRHLLLHVQGDELRHRRVPRRRAADAALHRLHVLRGVLPRSRGGPDHPLRRDGRADARARSTRSTSSRAASRSSRSGWRKKILLANPMGHIADTAFAAGPLARARRLVRRRRLRVPDLLRLLRLLGHGDRPRR